jgi:hypothetical protein
MEDVIHCAASGAIAGIVTDIIFYGLDSYKVMLQANQKVKLSAIYRGVLPIALTGTIRMSLIIFIIQYLRIT